MLTLDKVNGRITELKTELDKGQQQLQQLEKEKVITQQTVLRIGGAIQVLEEMLREVEAESFQKVAAVD